MVNKKATEFNHFGYKKAKAIRIKNLDTSLYVGDNGSVYEVTKHGPYGLFFRYRQIVESDNEPEYETCKECGQVHNEVAHRTYENPALPFSNKQRVVAAPPEGNNMEAFS